MLIYKEGEALHELVNYLEGEGGGPQCVEVRISSFLICIELAPSFAMHLIVNFLNSKRSLI